MDNVAHLQTQYESSMEHTRRNRDAQFVASIVKTLLVQRSQQPTSTMRRQETKSAAHRRRTALEHAVSQQESRAPVLHGVEDAGAGREAADGVEQQRAQVQIRGGGRGQGEQRGQEVQLRADSRR
jgi:hypothetical protein